MVSTLKRLCREPLVHFLSIGALLFVFYSLTADEGSGAPNRIVVTSSQVEGLVASFKRTWLRPPSDAELQALIDNHLREEVFYREALAMGLDRDDPLVRRRMRLKLEFILEDLSSLEVTDQALAEFLQANPDRFRHEVQLSFRHVYLNPDKRAEVTEDAKHVLSRLKAGAPADSVGDLTLTPAAFNLAAQSEIARDFGKGFAERLVELNPGDWVGPIESPFGVHLVKVSERIEASQPPLAEIRQWVEREFLARKREQKKDLAFQQLRENYQVSIELPGEGKDVKGGFLASAQAGEPQ